MDDMGAVSVVHQVIGDGLTGLLGQNGFIRIFPSAEIVYIHAGENFKFRVDGSGPDHRYVKVARRTAFHIPGKVWDGIFRKRHIL